MAQRASYILNGDGISIVNDTGGAMTVSTVWAGSPGWDDAVALVAASPDQMTPAPPPTPEQAAANLANELKREINAERDRRVLMGADIDVSGYGSIPVQGGPTDQINLLALGATAMELIAAGITGAVIPFRDALNVMHQLTPAQIAELVRKGKMVVTAIYAASWALKDANPIPEDFTDDSHWP
jgi:hypothetical protein